MIKAKARYGFKNIVVDDCPFCHHTHYHNHPVMEGVRMADCFQGEYLLDFEAAQPSGQEDLPKTHCVICGQSNHTAIACPDFDHASPR